MRTIKYTNQVSLVFPSRSANEGFARSAAACFAAQLDPTLDELEDIKTAVSEAVTNAIVHAYPDTMGKVAAEAPHLPGQRCWSSPCGTGAGASRTWSRPAQPMFTTGGEERSGMGFTIMESFMDAREGPLHPRQGDHGDHAQAASPSGLGGKA